jgi:predicted secreted protein
MAKYAAYGTALKKGATTIAAVSSLSGPNLQADTIDVTTHDSVNATREFVSGLIDAGEVSGALIFDPNVATHIGLWNDLVARTSASYSLVFTFTGGIETCTFTAYVTGFGPIESQPDGAVTAAFTLKVAAAPVWS